MPDYDARATGYKSALPESTPLQARRTIAPIVLLVLATIVGFGFASLVMSNPKTSWPEAAYRSIGLFYHDSGWAFDPKAGTGNRWFKLLAVVAPFFTALTVIYIATDWLPSVLVRLRAFGSLTFRGRAEASP